MFEALGRVIYRRRRWVVALALAFVVFAGVWGTGVFGAMTGGGFEDPDSDSSRAVEVAERELGRGGGDVVVLYSQRRPDRRRPALADAVDQLAWRPCPTTASSSDDDLLEHRAPAAGRATTARRPTPS